jgi:radical SAM superfamily enzyme YgiQ (UPF0313 family)
MKREIADVLDDEICKIDFDSVNIIGFTAKYHQWIAGIILANEIKKRRPDIGIVIGGINNSEQAKEILRICGCFDYAIWGEGEFPLLKLCQYINKNTVDIESIPRLVFRVKDDLVANRNEGDYVDFKDYHIPDYGDYMGSIDKKRILSIVFPIESKRGCSWNKCNFCSSNIGYRYRVRDINHVINEIKYQTDKHGVNKYQFVDNDLVGHSIKQFEYLLDSIIEYNYSSHNNISLVAEILHSGFNSRLIKKMALAGLNVVQIGYEAIADNLLKIMNKKVDFADHLLFIKFTSKYGIAVLGANIIRGVIGETKNDVIESIYNMKYLRFFIEKLGYGFFHNISRLRLDFGTNFYNMIEEKDRQKWDFHPIASLIPKTLTKEESKFNLFGYYHSIENEYEWKLFEKMNKYYYDNDYKYTIYCNDGKLYYREYLNEKIINIVVFDEPEYRAVLELANDEVVSFDYIYEQIEKKYAMTNRLRLIKIIDELQSLSLIYSNKDKNRIISIIDTSLIT